MSNNNHKPSGFDYEPVGRVYSPNTQVITNKDGTITLKPSQNVPDKKSGK